MMMMTIRIVIGGERRAGIITTIIVVLVLVLVRPRPHPPPPPGRCRACATTAHGPLQSIMLFCVPQPRPRQPPPAAASPPRAAAGAQPPGSLRGWPPTCQPRPQACAPEAGGGGNGAAAASARLPRESRAAPQARGAGRRGRARRPAGSVAIVMTVSMTASSSRVGSTNSVPRNNPQASATGSGPSCSRRASMLTGPPSAAATSAAAPPGCAPPAAAASPSVGGDGRSATRHLAPSVTAGSRSRSSAPAAASSAVLSSAPSALRQYTSRRRTHAAWACNPPRRAAASALPHGAAGGRAGGRRRVASLMHSWVRSTVPAARSTAATRSVSQCDSGLGRPGRVSFEHSAGISTATSRAPSCGLSLCGLRTGPRSGPRLGRRRRTAGRAGQRRRAGGTPHDLQRDPRQEHCVARLGQRGGGGRAHEASADAARAAGDRGGV